MAKAADTTLFSGGLRGAESEFGINCEKYGVKEVTLSFEGHKPMRQVNIKTLSPEELKKGDVSMEIVSLSMGRVYTRTELIRKIMQSIFHMINSGHQVFAIGWIQDNDTVKGGTGWGVELAKLFNRPLFVFDQDKSKWFTWRNSAWEEETPVITHDTFAGTGTRNLTEEGKKAISDLFERSFG